MPLARAVYANTNQSADALYMTRTHVPDAFIIMELDNERIGIFNAMELNRMRTQSAIATVLPLEEYYEKAKAAFGVAIPGPGDILAILARERRLVSVQVGADFPALVLRQAERRGLIFEVTEGPLFPERRIKSDDEAAEIRKGNIAACAGFDAVKKMLANASVAGDGTLVLGGETLTSERVHSEIEIACIRRGAWAMETILAGGEQACDPHCEGHGPLRAGELIVADIFPRLASSGFFGDMTRTFIKGNPSPEQRRLVETVAEGQKMALARIRGGADGRAIHMAVTEFFASKGYPTGMRNGRNVGFFHGLGHGVGLDIHEAPRMNRSGAPLAAGNVVTAEPGLYFPGLGGCRIEDVVRVTAEGCEMLSDYPYDWIIQ
jgi:Xaa-Pro aminopeptidase